jgi:hypothetical protein
MNPSKSNATSSKVSICVQNATSLAKNYDGVVITSGRAQNVHTDDPMWQCRSVACTSEADRQVRKYTKKNTVQRQYTQKYLWANKVECRRLKLLTLGGGSIAVAHPSAALCTAFSKSSRNSSNSLTLRCSQVPQDNTPACLPSVGVTTSLKRGRMDESSEPPSCWLMSRARLFMAPWKKQFFNINIISK